jgi:rhodanese-related sulfurtransferase
MDQSNWGTYALFGGLGLFFVWRKWKSNRIRPLIHEYLEKGAVILDVRSPEEFSSGHGVGSINIPLNLIQTRVRELDKDKPLIVCCASGMRSANAVSYLKSQGFKDILNAGPWQNAVRS